VTLKTKFIILGAILVLVTAVAEWLNVENNLSAAEQQTAVEVVQRHMDADMKHDGIRGNVFSALAASKLGDAQLLNDSQNEIKSMSEEFAKDVEANLQADLPENIKAQFEKIEKSVKDYAEYSNKMGANAQDFESVRAMLPEFNRVFEVLEEDQGNATDLILAWSKNIHAASQAYSMALQIVLILLFTCAVGLPVFAIWYIFKPLDGTIEAMKSLSDGNTNHVIPFTARQDELGTMAKTLQVFKENALERVRLEEAHIREKARQAEAETQAALRAEAEKRQMLHDMANEFEASINSVLASVNASVSDLQAAAENMTQIAEEATSKTATVAEASEMTAQSVQVVVQSTEEMVKALNDISNNVERSADLVNEAVAKADGADKTTSTLSIAAKEITTVIELIQEITARINLLSLNAAIEAAIAGESGKGFAVVASEVKRLAVQTADATENIAVQIKNVQSVSSDVVSSLGSIRGSITTMNEFSSGIASAMEEQNAMTNQIATYMREASQNVQRINLSVDDIQMTAQSTASSAEQVLQASRDVARQSGELNHSVQEFVSRIRRG
jgi:methyl-accepting chemotaxis protein